MRDSRESLVCLISGETAQSSRSDASLYVRTIFPEFHPKDDQTKVGLNVHYTENIFRTLLSLREDTGPVSPTPSYGRFQHQILAHIICRHYLLNLRV